MSQEQAPKVIPPHKRISRRLDENSGKIFPDSQRPTLPSDTHSFVGEFATKKAIHDVAASGAVGESLPTDTRMEHGYV